MTKAIIKLCIHRCNPKVASYRPYDLRLTKRKSSPSHCVFLELCTNMMLDELKSLDTTSFTANKVLKYYKKAFLEDHKENAHLLSIIHGHIHTEIQKQKASMGGIHKMSMSQIIENAKRI